VSGARAAATLFDPRRLQLAREAAGLRKVALAELVGISAAAISQFEHGATRPSPATLARLALALDMPVEFFEARQDETPVSPVASAFFRSLRSTTQLSRSCACARATLVWEIADVLEAHVHLPDVRLPDNLTVDEDANREILESAAGAARNHMGVEHGPVPHVVRLMEAHGVLVSRLRTEDRRVSAFSQWVSGRPLVVLGADSDDAGRSRFDAAHELGHLVLHAEPEAGNAILERQADRFAAAFLLPDKQIGGLLPHTFDLRALLALKRTWGVSIAALMYRARELGRMSDSAYRRGVVWMSQEYGRRNEPGDLGEPERPLMLRRAAELAFTANPVAALAAAARLRPALIRELLDTRDSQRPALTPDALLEEVSPIRPGISF
jgi:Zn-dependent peptidase ImmA (M78 family)/transcriptional regulator with XRE-family HTH domain